MSVFDGIPDPPPPTGIVDRDQPTDLTRAAERCWGPECLGSRRDRLVKCNEARLLSRGHGCAVNAQSCWSDSRP
jgi:hypothetical protein